MGSLFGLLEKKVKQMKEKQVDSASIVLRMPGGVFGDIMTTKIAMQVCVRMWQKCDDEIGLLLLVHQVALALQFIHTVGIIYRDLKAANVLVWSMAPKDKGEL